jgi:hypothetical protein
MQAIFSNLVAASLFIHAMIGCCWHHAHDSSCCDESPAEQVVETNCCHHDHGDRNDTPLGEPSHAPCQGQSHCQGLCNYLPVQKTQLDTVDLSVPLDYAIIAPATYEIQVAALLHMERVHETAAKPPMRLHLFHQILLI